VSCTVVKRTEKEIILQLDTVEDIDILSTAARTDLGLGSNAVLGFIDNAAPEFIFTTYKINTNQIEFYR
jgi:hypothetical protein